MKQFIGGMIFGIVIYPALSYCASIIETAANVVVTKLSVVMAKDANQLEQDDSPVCAIGFTADDCYDEAEADE